MPIQTLVVGGEVDRWEQAIYAFLAEKERRSGSGRTVGAYSRMLLPFFGALDLAQGSEWRLGHSCLAVTM